MVKRDLFLDKFHLAEFQNYLLELDKATSTINLYLDNVIRFIEWIQANDGMDLEIEAITTIDIRDYRSYLQNDLSQEASTVNNKIASLKSYFGFLYVDGIIKKDPAASIKRIKLQQKSEAKSFDEKTYRAIRREIYRNGSAVHIAIWEVLTKTGCRVSELCNLKLEDIKISERGARISICGKGNKIRELKLHTDAKNAIQEYLKARSPIKTDSKYLFLSERKEKYTRSAVWKILKKYSERIGCHISVHQCRHYFCRYLLKSGIDISTVAALAGHSNPLVTVKTYTVSSIADQDDAIEKL